ncbi:CAAX protease self-immunity-domain-containing protein [Gorgonomyces haynaldii]|nr:CAAX protease self-immunity-domain-containing protein [Gorgonomyces haynaldii]
MGLSASLAVHSLSAFKTLGLALCLFLGPVYTRFTNGTLLQEEEPWIMFRNYVFAPTTEELVFRSCLMTFLLKDYSPLTSVLLAPLYFGLAHVHHGYSVYRQSKKLVPVVVSVVFQFAYTTLFGWFAAYALVRTRSIVGPILAHMFCNYMGFPSFDFMNDRGAYVHLFMHICGLGLFAVLMQSF